MQNPAIQESMNTDWLPKNWKVVLSLTGLCILAYLPAFDNGFISDDYVILGRLDSLQHDVLFLFQVPPECFRLTSYLCFGILKSLFGYQAAWYYAFNLVLHLINSILLWKLLARVTRSSRVALLAAAIFASAQGHQEAIMWLAAMNETLLGLCLLACLLLWDQDLYGWGAVMFFAGLFSKESALIFLALLPLLTWRSKGLVRFHRGHALILGIAAAFTFLFLTLFSSNFMISAGTYAFSIQAAPVWLLSLHKMMFPWIYLAIGLHMAQRRGWKELRSATWGLCFAAIALLPYVFLTYRSAVTSRQEYLASMGLVWALAVLIQGLSNPQLRRAFILILIVANIATIWIKDRQFEERAVPTNRLIERLKGLTPQNIAIFDFPANLWVAKIAARLAPGWQAEMIYVDPAPSDCPACPALRWDPGTSQYLEINKK
jgi:hypothetical protein